MKKAGTPGDRQPQDTPPGTSGTAPAVGTPPVERKRFSDHLDIPTGHARTYVQLLEDVALAAKRRQIIWSAISAYTPKQHQQAQKDFKLALDRLEAFK